MTSKRRYASKTTSSYGNSSDQQDEQSEDFAMTEQQPSPEPKPIARQAVYETDRIGDILRRVREHRGEDLDYISEYLRIRPNYLFALENSRYEDLPADAYVIGFLRTYASYLGLDGKGAIDQYRREMTGRRRKPQLSMPQPMSEGRAPTIAMMIAAALAALIIYGVWYGLSSPDHEDLEKTVALPEVVQTTPAKEVSTLPAQTATTDGIELSVPAAAVPATEQVHQQQTQASQTSVTPKPEEKPAAGANKSVTDTKTAPPPSTPATSQPEATTPPPEQTQAAAPPTKLEPATVYGDKGKTRMTIRADKESWVLITDEKGNTVFDRTLKPGESYNVPSGKGLKLTTGNANGISLTYDGKEIPKQQNASPLIRAMPLDANTIKSRMNAAPTNTDLETDQDQ